jgi:hypothetical protein
MSHLFVILFWFLFLCSEIFVENEINLDMFKTLTDEDFTTLGIRSFGARKIMLNTIQGINLFPPSSMRVNRFIALFFISSIRVEPLIASVGGGGG